MRELDDGRHGQRYGDPPGGGLGRLETGGVPATRPGGQVLRPAVLHGRHLPVGGRLDSAGSQACAGHHQPGVRGDVLRAPGGQEPQGGSGGGRQA